MAVDNITLVPAVHRNGTHRHVPEHWLGDASPFPGQWSRADGPATETKTAAPVAIVAPARADNKAAWVDYAVAAGDTREDAEAMTKDALIDTYAQEA